MTVSYMDFSPRRGAKQPNLFDDDRLEAAVSAYLAREYPTQGKRKQVARRFKLTDDEAKAACEGAASKSVINKILQAERWRIGLELLAIMFGEGVDQHLARERERHEQRARQIGEHLRDLRLASSGGSRDGAGGGSGVAGRLAARSSRMGQAQADEID